VYYREIKSEKLVTEKDIRQLQDTVGEILHRVKLEGDEALRFYEKKFDNYEPDSFRVTTEEAAKAKEKLPAAVIEELDFAIQQVSTFARAQKESMVEFEKEIAPGMKMGQRIIPVVEPPVNATLDFVGTVSRVYYNGKDHRGIALKRMTYWLDQVRTQYGMNTTTTDAAFAQVLASKSGAAAELAKALSDWCAALRGGMPVNDKELLTFSGLIDQFQKSTIS